MLLQKKRSFINKSLDKINLYVIYQVHSSGPIDTSFYPTLLI